MQKTPFFVLFCIKRGFYAKNIDFVVLVFVKLFVEAFIGYRQVGNSGILYFFKIKILGKVQGAVFANGIKGITEVKVINDAIVNFYFDMEIFFYHIDKI